MAFRINVSGVIFFPSRTKEAKKKTRDLRPSFLWRLFLQPSRPTSIEDSFDDLVVGHLKYLCKKLILIRRGRLFTWFNARFSWSKIIKVRLIIRGRCYKNIFDKVKSIIKKFYSEWLCNVPITLHTPSSLAVLRTILTNLLSDTQIYIWLNLLKRGWRNFKCILAIWHLSWMENSEKSLAKAPQSQLCWQQKVNFSRRSNRILRCSKQHWKHRKSITF